MARALVHSSLNSPEAHEKKAHAISKNSGQTAQIMQADLSLRWSHKSYCRFCRALAQLIWMGCVAYMDQEPNYRLPLQHLAKL